MLQIDDRFRMDKKSAFKFLINKNYTALHTDQEGDILFCGVNEFDCVVVWSLVEEMYKSANDHKGRPIQKYNGNIYLASVTTKQDAVGFVLGSMSYLQLAFNSEKCICYGYRYDESAYFKVKLSDIPASYWPKPNSFINPDLKKLNWLLKNDNK